MEKLLTQYEWLKLNNYERLLMVELFAIRRSTGTVMQDSKIITDGHTMEDLNAVNVASMQAFLESKEEDFDALYEKTLEKMRGILAERTEASQKIRHDEYVEANHDYAVRLAESILKSIKALPIEAQQVIRQELDVMLGQVVAVPEEAPKKKKNVTK